MATSSSTITPNFTIEDLGPAPPLAAPPKLVITAKKQIFGYIFRAHDEVAWGEQFPDVGVEHLLDVGC